ncbi:MAG: hypothetical protein JW900_07320 [Anaerolineae bacterium]|nr:hypothetical protein [Anaerolineae bacterium]
MKGVLKTAEEVLSWFEERQARKEAERDARIRQGKLSIQKHIDHQQRMARKLWELGKRALRLGDEAQFRRIGALYLQTQEDVGRWQRYQLTFETLEVRRDQAQATVEVLGAMKAMSESLAQAAPSQSMERLQQNLAEGLSRAESLEERMAVMLELTDETLLSGAPSSEPQMSELREMMGIEAAQEEEAMFDSRVEEGLRRIREEMEKDR